MKKALVAFAVLAFTLSIVTACSSSSSSSTVAGPPQECVTGAGTCDCGPAETGSTTTPCSETSVGGTAICCGDEAYFTSGGGNGACSCTTFACTQTADDCECNSGAGGNGTVVPTCAPVGAGNVCCLDSSGDRCFCNVSATACQDGQNTIVTSCSVTSLVKICDAFYTAQPHPFTDCRTGT